LQELCQSLFEFQAIDLLLFNVRCPVLASEVLCGYPEFRSRPVRTSALPLSVWQSGPLICCCDNMSHGRAGVSGENVDLD